MFTIRTTDGDLVIEHPTDTIAVMRMPRMFDEYTSPTIRGASIDVVNHGTYRIIVDLTGTDFITSMGLGVLVGMQKRARAHDGTVAVVYASKKIAKAFRVTTMDKVFEIYATVDEALAALRQDDPAQSIETTIQDKQAEDITADFPVVTLCGSMRFYPRLLEVAAQLTAAGQIVLMPHDASLTGIANKTAIEHGAMLDAMHRQKIRMSGSVYIVNTGGYVGESTRSEIAYATSLGIPIQYDEET